MTYKDICRRLALAGIEQPEVDAALLLEHYFDVSRAALPLRREEQFDSPALEEAAARRTERCPLQYILGRWGFRGFEFDVAPGVLIPRPDTELIVETALRELGQGGRFVDLGCGSGCISISLALERPDVRGVAVDISKTALELARRNAARYGLLGSPDSTDGRLELRTGDMLSDATWRELGRTGPFDAIISNPPYIPCAELAGLAPELGFEPSLALDGGDDGLDFYRSLISHGGELLSAGGFMLFECGVGQTAAIASLGSAAGFESELLYDIEKRDRGVLLRK